MEAQLICAAVILAIAGLGLPSGWRRPTPHESRQEWRSDNPNRYLLVRADFDGDSLIDEAALLVRTDKPIAALVVRLGGRAAPLVLDELGEVLWLDVMGIDLVQPGRYPTFYCERDPKCEPGEPAKLVLDRPSIDLFKEGSANSYFFYDPATTSFRRVWMSD